jgi:rare lipoprotein A
MRGALPIRPAVLGLAVLLLPALLLSGCAETNLIMHGVKSATQAPASPQVPPSYKVGEPYQVAGVWYYPRVDYDYDENGIASWYGGPDYQGKPTANGEIFDGNAVSGAHRTLPLPSLVRVTNLDNGRSLVVRINDRGPYKPGRIVDLSRRAAQLLDFDAQGQAKVRVQILAEESQELASRIKALYPSQDDAPAPVAATTARPQIAGEALAPPPGTRQAPPTRIVAARGLPTANASTRQVMIDSSARSLDHQEVVVVPVKASRIFIQAGAFSRFDYANRRSAQVAPVAKATISQFKQRDRSLYRVRVGPLNTVEEADKILHQLLASGIPDAQLVVE